MNDARTIVPLRTLFLSLTILAASLFSLLRASHCEYPAHKLPTAKLTKLDKSCCPHGKTPTVLVPAQDGTSGQSSDAEPSDSRSHTTARPPSSVMRNNAGPGRVIPVPQHGVKTELDPYDCDPKPDSLPLEKPCGPTLPKDWENHCHECEEKGCRKIVTEQEVRHRKCKVDVCIEVYEPEESTEAYCDIQCNKDGECVEVIGTRTVRKLVKRMKVVTYDVYRPVLVDVPRLKCMKCGYLVRHCPPTQKGPCKPAPDSKCESRDDIGS